MSIDWQNGAADRGRNPLPESYKPRALRLAAAESVPPAPPAAWPEPAAPTAWPEPAAPTPWPQDVARADASREPPAPPVPPVVDLRRLEVELGRKRLDEIADVVRALTYGEMMELAESMWSVRPEDSELNEHNLPALLYRWSTSRKL